MAFREGEFRRCDPGIKKEDVDPREGLAALGEGLDASVGREVEGPHFDDGGAGRGLFDGGFGGRAGGRVADGEDHFRGVKGGEVAGGFEAEADVRARDNDGAGGEGGGGERGGEEELVVEEAHDGGGLSWVWWLLGGKEGCWSGRRKGRVISYILDFVKRPSPYHY